MGVSYRTHVVAGILAQDAISFELKEKQEKKFNPDTGEPVERITQWYEASLFGKPVPDLEPSPYEWEYLKVDGERVLGGLKVFSTGRERGRAEPGNPFAAYDYGDYVLGVPLHTASGGDTAVYELLDRLRNDALVKVRAILDKVGCKKEPGIFIVSHVSY